MPAQAMAMTMIVSIVVDVAVAVVRMSAGVLCFVVHPLDSNRDSVWLTAGIRGGSDVNNGVNRSDPQERTCWPERN